MIRNIDIQDRLLSLIGWEQGYENLRVSSVLTKSETGIYFQHVHPLLTLQNISCIAPDFKNVSYDKFVFGNAYTKGHVVTSEDGKLYKAIKNSESIQLENSEYWVLTNPFSEWLESKTRASITKAISRFINDKLIKKTYKNLFENRTLFDGTGRICDTIKNQKNIVGFEIVPIRSKGVTTKINKIGLQFTKPGKYEIFIMHSSCNTPVYTLTFEKVKENSVEWFEVDDVYLPYQSTQTDAGGSWYICYSQSNLPFESKAIRKERDWSQGPCNSCSKNEYAAWQIWSKYIEVHPFFVNEELVWLEENKISYLWDIENNQYIYNTNFGINLDLTISCDITDFILEQRGLFADVIAKQVAIDMLREFAYNANARANRNSINVSRLDIIYEIDGDASQIKKSGLSYQLEQAFKAIELTTEGMDRVCLPCKNNGVKYRSI